MPAWLPGLCSDRPSPPFPELRRYNERYAARHGYRYLLHDGHFTDQQGGPICPYWGKVRAMRQAVAEGGASYVLFLDTDAVVHDMDRWGGPACAATLAVR